MLLKLTGPLIEEDISKALLKTYRSFDRRGCKHCSKLTGPLIEEDVSIAEVFLEWRLWPGGLIIVIVPCGHDRMARVGSVMARIHT